MRYEQSPNAELTNIKQVLSKVESRQTLRWKNAPKPLPAPIAKRITLIQKRFSLLARAGANTRSGKGTVELRKWSTLTPPPPLQNCSRDQL